MITNFSKCFSSHSQKWYIQPLDPRSAEHIYRRLKGKMIHPDTATGCPNNNGYSLCEATRSEVESLMEEMSLGALTRSEVTDFGLNFFVYRKEKEEEKPHFCFATTEELREKNGKEHKERLNLGFVPLTVVRSEKPTPQKEEPMFSLRRQTTETQKTDIKKPEVRIGDKRPSLFRISTHHKKVLPLLKEELLKAGKTSEPIPNLKEGPEEVWNTPPSVVMAMKIHAKHGFYYFRIWRRDDRGGYVLTGEYPRQIK